MSIEYQNFLAHHGVKGQKWGVRRYQNDDGTLTELGKQRYGGQKEYADSKVRRTLGGDWGFEKMSQIGDNNTRKNIAKYDAKAEEYKSQGNERRAQRNEKKAQQERDILEARKASSANRDAYRRHTSTAKLIAQNAMLGPNAYLYRHARARGAGRAVSFIESFGLFSLPAQAYGDYNDYKHYGSTLAAHSDVTGDAI